MPIPTNPYIAGNPVGDSPAFIGRADVLREVTRVLRQPQSNAIVLYGQRRIGKTSILQHLEARLPDEGPYRAVYFDLQDKAEWPLERVLGDLAQTIGQALNQTEPGFGEDAPASFRQTWLPSVLDALPNDHSLVLLFDEFDVLSDPQGEQAARAFFPYLRELMADDPARLQFVFVIGRNVGDLNAIALSLFKGTPYKRVSLLSEDDTAALARLSEVNNTLTWGNDAIAALWALTHGHPFLTQQLCSHVWEAIYDDDPDGVPTATASDVEDAISDTLQASENALEWLWNGLGPAERMVTSALAEAGPGPITREKLERILQESGVRVLIRELQNAPQLLQEWDIVEPDDGGYRFRVELLRRWIAERKPLNRVQDELDRILPVADNLYRAASSLYNSRQFDQAMQLLRQAVRSNPNHVKANQLLADILLAQGQPEQAQQLLDELYAYQPAAARPRLVQALLMQATAAEDDDTRLEFYEQVLTISPTNPEAVTAKRRIWEQRGDQLASLHSRNLEKALEAYQNAGLPDKVAAAQNAIRRRDLQAGQAQVETLEDDGAFANALDLARKLTEQYPEHDWGADIARLEAKTNLHNLYTQAMDALQKNEALKARNLLIEIVKLEPTYKETTRYLHLAVTGTDVVEIEERLDEIGERLEQETVKHSQTRDQLADIQAQLDRTSAGNRQLRNELEDRNHEHQQLRARLNWPWWKHVPKWAWSLSGVLLIAFAIVSFFGGFTVGSNRPTTATPKPTSTATQTLAPILSATFTPTFTPMPPDIPTALPTDTPTPTVMPTNTSTAPITATTPTLGDTWTRPDDDMVMAYVPAGTFQMGSADGNEDETPVHTVTLDAFWIDRTEVTNAQYQRCVDTDACTASRYQGDADFGGDDQPVVGVDWNQADTYCTWVGGRLPTEAEWEYAARGPKGFTYPWGNDFDCKLGNFDDETELDSYVVPGGEGCDGYIRTSPVGSFPDGASWVGAYDMAGNVWEWVADWYGDYPGGPQDNPIGPETGEYKVLRGGSWFNIENGGRSTNRDRFRPAYTYFLVGFRCIAARQGQ